MNETYKAYSIHYLRWYIYTYNMLIKCYKMLHFSVSYEACSYHSCNINFWHWTLLSFFKFENKKSILFKNFHLTMVKWIVCPIDFRGYVPGCVFACWLFEGPGKEWFRWNLIRGKSKEQFTNSQVFVLLLSLKQYLTGDVEGGQTLLGM